MAKDDKTKDEAAEAPAAPSRAKFFITLGLGALLLVAVSVATTWWLVGGRDTAQADDEEIEAPAKNAKADKKDKKAKKTKKEKETNKGVITYLPLDPPFVVNSQDPGAIRYLQVSMEVMVRDPAAIEDVKKHMPVIRNSLVMLLSGQSSADVNNRDGKERLRAAALAEVQKILEQQTGKTVVEALYFTSFVMQ